jgi:hypothetical protein
MNGIMRKEYPNHLLNKMHSVAYSDGMPPRARLYAERIMEVLKEVNMSDKPTPSKSNQTQCD